MSNSAYGELLESPCPSCGGKLLYSAEKESLCCAHCGFLEQPDRSNDRIAEQALQDYLVSAETFSPQETGQKTYICEGCGAKTLVEARDVRTVCGFCGSDKVNETAFDQNLIRPQGVIPFAISRQEAIVAFDNWIGKGWFRPSKLEKSARIDDLHGIYVPTWTYDAQTESDWEGEAGFHYYVQQTVVINGKTTTRSVRHTRWEYRSGHLGHFFDDVVVFGSQAHSAEKLRTILPFDFSSAINFDPRLLLGWEAEVYDIEVDKGYIEAERIMDGRIRALCSDALGGDTQRGLQVSTEKSQQTFKLLLVPVWICAYRYGGKTYGFQVNGQTGKIDGSKPISWIKVFFFVLFLVLIGLAAYWYYTAYR